MTDSALNQRAVEHALARLLVDTGSRHTAVVRVGGAPLFWQGADPDADESVALGPQIGYKVENFDFAHKRLALEALAVTVVANGQDWQLYGPVPFDDMAP